eukprot:TRINITY_DN329_c0_g2_i1.p1 TRINITY_DN329_c0_g2~~TRINITY_DN329_c0_g2_i1.p1  ORF type:complete len:144 (+),score=12.57 TRINITY_DN329_c0_g2_i1:85-516(+)
MNCLRATSSGLRYRPCFVTHQRRTFLVKKKTQEEPAEASKATGVMSRFAPSEIADRMDQSIEKRLGKTVARFLTNTMIGRMIRRVLLVIYAKVVLAFYVLAALVGVFSIGQTSNALGYSSKSKLNTKIPKTKGRKKRRGKGRR